MLGKLLTKIFGTKNERDVKRMRERIPVIADFEAGLRGLSDEDLRFVLVTAGHALVARHSWAETAKRTHALLLEAAGR